MLTFLSFQTLLWWKRYPEQISDVSQMKMSVISISQLLVVYTTVRWDLSWFLYHLMQY